VKAEELLARAERVVRSRSVLQAVEAVVGPNKSKLVGLAQSAHQKLSVGEVPKKAELEALRDVICALRPSYLTRNGRISAATGDLAEDAGFVAAWDRFRAGFAGYVYSVGRLTCGHVSATGFMVAKDLVATNRHVVEKFTRGTMELNEGSAVVCFGDEYESESGEEPVPILRCAAVHGTEDLALLSIPPQASRPPLPYAGETPGVGDRVVVVGYPEPDSRRNPLFAETIFGNIYGVKRVSPGEVIRAKRQLCHDCSALGGNSGSPLIDMETARLVGVHAGGRFNHRNYTVWADALRTLVAAYRAQRAAAT
jgi:hypothetical protein